MKYISVIEISPSFVEMIICQKGRDDYEIIEKVREDINLFKGYQKTGKISFEKSQKLCEILKRMKELSENYGTYSIHIVTTSSFNQLDNAPFLMDQIKIHTGLLVNMPMLLEKKKLLFKKFLKYKDELTGDRKNTVILNIGSSTTDLVFLHNRKLIKNQIISTGGYKVAEFIIEEGLSPHEATEFMKDYIYNYLIETKKELGRKRLSKLVLIGEVREILVKKYREEGPVLNLRTEDVRSIIDDIRDRSFKNFARKNEMSEVAAIKAFVELCMLETITREFGIEDIAILSYDNKELHVYESFYPEERRRIEGDMWELTVQAAKALGEKYHFNPDHSEFTLRMSEKLYQVLGEKHNIPGRIFRYLEIANYLHDTGKYINFKGHNRHSEYIARNSFLFGLGERELEYISFLCYAHSGEELEIRGFLEGRSASERIQILKALAILKVAAALDRSKRQKAEGIRVELQGEEVNITVDTREEFLIEKLFFNKQVKFFKEVFGLTPKLHINRRYHGESL